MAARESRLPNLVVRLSLVQQPGSWQGSGTRNERRSWPRACDGVRAMSAAENALTDRARPLLQRLSSEAKGGSANQQESYSPYHVSYPSSVFQQPALMFAVKALRRRISSPACGTQIINRRTRQEAETEDAG
jgi:hypothetical protein